MIQQEPDKVRLALRRRAMDLLARREHTRHELSHKLTAAIKKSQQRLAAQNAGAETTGTETTGAQSTDELSRDQFIKNEEQQHLSTHQHEQMFAGLISEVLDKLEQDKLLSDSRFTESYVNARLNRGYGPLFIRHQLRQKQVDSVLLDNNLEQLEHEQWIEQLSALIRRRVRDAAFPERGSKEYLKLQRFVLSRGFTSSQWQEVEKHLRSP